MDAKEFLGEFDRMCITLKSQGKCNKEDCPIGKLDVWDIYEETRSSCCEEVCKFYSDEAVDIVEEWSKENPAKTRQSEFLKMFPKARTDNNIIDLCPAALDSSFTCNLKKHCISCSTCRKNYWSERID